MLPVAAAIARFRRDITLGTLLRGALGAGAGAALIMNLIPGLSLGATLVLMLIAVATLVLSYRSAAGTQLAAESPSLIAAGHYEEAEHQIEAALRSFSLFRASKVLSLHHLAVLRHAQKRWSETVALCGALLSHRLGSLGSLARPSRLMLADALMELGDMPGAYRAISWLYTQRLSLPEAINLLRVQVDYEARCGAWQLLASPRSIESRLQLCELMPGAASARTQALIALAAKRTGQMELADRLVHRAELLADPKLLVKERSMLSELWPVEQAS